jgi:4-amino-4-deoxy-L-arabinose transferase-like glycosyltransferase
MTVSASASRIGARGRRHVVAVPVVAVAALANGWALTRAGWGNAYYAAAVRSMGSSWHDFLFASFDPGGFVSVDKPPLSLWVQVVFTAVLGYRPLAVLLPGMLAGTAAVALVYVGVARVWGRTAAAVAAAALAVTPISVMVAHSNNTDAVLVLVMTAAAVAAVQAVHSGRLRWLVAAAAIGGSAVTAKMLAGVPVLPGILVAYLWCAPRSWRVRLGHVAVGAAVMAVAALWWFVLVDLTPADARPYVGSSPTNSAFQLAFERNGVDQVDGTMGAGPGGSSAGPGVGVGGPAVGGVGPYGRLGPYGRPLPGGPVPGGQAPGAVPGGAARPGGPGGPGFGGGDPGALRLFNAELGGQAGWLVPFGLIGAVGLLWSLGLRPSARLGALVVFGGWFAVAAGAFSVTKGIVHPYYLANIGPPLAALVGMAVGSWREDLAARHLRAVLLPVALVATAWGQWAILDPVEWSRWLRPAVAVAAGAAALVAGAVWVRRAGPRGVLLAVAVAAAVLLVAPALWTRAALAVGVDGPLPFAYPTTVRAGAPAGAAPVGGVVPNGGFRFASGDTGALVAYLRANRGEARWLVAVESAAPAEPIIIGFGEPVMAMGGFSGSDPILTVESLQQLIDDGRVRFFWLASDGAGGRGAPGGGGGPGGTGRLSSVVARACPVVPAARWQTTAGASGVAGTAGGAGQTSFPGGPASSAFDLRDCRGVRLTG